MDVLEQVRDIGSEARGADDAATARMRTALLTEAATSAHPVRTRRRIIGATAFAGAAVIVAVTAVSVFAPQQAQRSEAAEILAAAAAMTVSSQDLAVGAGQFLKIEIDRRTLMPWDADMGADWARFNNGNPADAEAALLRSDTETLYVPADRSAEWVWDRTTLSSIVDTVGDRVSEAERDFDALQAESGDPAASDVLRLPGGVITDGSGAHAIDSARDEYATAPRDPQALLDHIAADAGVDAEEFDDWFVESSLDPLQLALMPADLRATWFEAIALLPSVEVVGTDGDHATLAYVETSEWWTSRTEMVIDTSLGQLLSVTRTQSDLDGGRGIVPPDMPDESTTITLSVVDSAP